jgi:hypothetical protein
MGGLSGGWNGWAKWRMELEWVGELQTSRGPRGTLGSQPATLPGGEAPGSRGVGKVLVRLRYHVE